MITVREDTTLVGVSELRNNIDKILEKSKKHKVLIEKRHKPVAVLMDMERYQQMEATLELLEDYALGLLAKERDAKSTPSDYLSIEELQKRLDKK
jgi:prevent-host-death family protein